MVSAHEVVTVDADGKLPTGCPADTRFKIFREGGSLRFEQIETPEADEPPVEIRTVTAEQAEWLRNLADSDPTPNEALRKALRCHGEANG